MSTKAGVGMSQHHNPNVAGRDAAKQALENAELEKPDFVFIFRLCFNRQADVPRSGEAAAPQSIPPRGQSGSAMGGFLYFRGDRPGWRAHLLLQLHGSCPRLTVAG
jgi:hypothetical protein